MMGRTVSDPENTEGGGSLRGMGLLPIDTVFRPSKTTDADARHAAGDRRRARADFSGLAVEGYEIHMGETARDASAKPLVRLLRTGRRQSRTAVRRKTPAALICTVCSMRRRRRCGRRRHWRKRRA